LFTFGGASMKRDMVKRDLNLEHYLEVA